MKKILLILGLAVISSASFAQQAAEAPIPVPASVAIDAGNPAGFLAQITDPVNVALGTYVLSQIADSTTDWHFTAFGKQYSVSPTKRTAFAGGTLGAAIAIAHYFPKAKTPVTVAMVVATSIFAGRAYANTLNHGAPPGGNVAVLSSKYSFSFRLH